MNSLRSGRIMLRRRRDGISGRRGTRCRRGVHRCGVRNVWSCSHGAFRIEQVIVARSESEADQSARIRHFFRLPSVIGLVTAHRLFAFLIPESGRLAVHVMFANQGFLNGLGARGIDLLLAFRVLALRGYRFLRTLLLRNLRGIPSRVCDLRIVGAVSPCVGTGRTMLRR